MAIMLAFMLLATSMSAQNGPRIRRVEGQGNDGLVLDLAPGMHDSILNSPTSTYAYPLYDFNAGPVKIDVFDPAVVPQGNFTIYFTDTAQSIAKWVLIYHGTVNDTVFGDSTVSAGHTQIIPQWGMSVWTGPVQNPGQTGAINNGFLEATMTFSNSNQWLTGVPDSDSLRADNWIRSGTSVDLTGNPVLSYYNDYIGSGTDPGEAFENLLGGTWAPYRLVANTDQVNGPSGAPGWKGSFMNLTKLSQLASVDIVITPDQSKWSRCPVLEICDYTISSVGNARKLDLRNTWSVNKLGQTVAQTGYANPNDPNAADYIDSTGMGWFPGYAINVETGERLNIVFGENSSLPNENGADMIWNPTTTVFDTAGTAIFGGGHYIYIFGHNADGVNDVNAYDGGAKIRSVLDGQPPDAIKREIFRHAMWVNLPLRVQGQQLLSSEVSIRLRVVKRYATQLNSSAFPKYTFSTTNLFSISQMRLSSLEIYPNPAEDKLHLRNLGASEAEYAISDISGRTIVKGICREDQPVNVEQLKPGMYLVKIASGSTIQTAKFIVQ